MKNVYGYIRVSTAKQGEGVSLIAQKEAIERYAQQYNLNIIEWFEEKETAAKQGRPLFNNMMKLLKLRKASGVIIHKIDRGARNLKDWSDIGNLIDQGIEVHFAHESLDMQARGGRLSADIQAVIAADYIRNLRQEAIKGLYGRLKQGILPFPAPIGYLNTGKGKLKAIDPVKGPLVKKAFELYSTGQYSFLSLPVALKEIGLTTGTGKPIKRTDLSRMLNNPYYMGIIRIKGTTFNGLHEPLITPALFKKVQQTMKWKTNQKIVKHDFTFKRLIKCGHCGFSLVAETQKGNVYYRCHTKDCETKGIRESHIDLVLKFSFKQSELYKVEQDILDKYLQDFRVTSEQKQEEMLRSIKLQAVNIEKKIEQLMDHYFEESLEKDIYERRKTKLLIELKEKEAAVKKLETSKGIALRKTERILELAKSLTQTSKMVNREEKLELIKTVTSNLSVQGKKLMVSMCFPFSELAKPPDVHFGAPTRDTPRQTPLVFDTLNIKAPCVRKPLTREQLRVLFDLIVEEVQNQDSDDEYLH